MFNVGIASREGPKMARCASVELHCASLKSTRCVASWWEQEGNVTHRNEWHRPHFLYHLWGTKGFDVIARLALPARVRPAVRPPPHLLTPLPVAFSYGNRTLFCSLPNATRLENALQNTNKYTQWNQNPCTCFWDETKTGLRSNSVIFQHRPTFSHINRKLSPRPL